MPTCFAVVMTSRSIDQLVPDGQRRVPERDRARAPQKNEGPKDPLRRDTEDERTRETEPRRH